MSLDAQTRKTKEAELETWQRNLATLQAQAALHGMAPPVEIVNEIEAAKRNIGRVQNELDAGQAQSIDATLTGHLELLLSIKRQQDGQQVHMAGMEQRLAGMEQRLAAMHRRDNPSATATASRLGAIAILFAVYTALVIKELRDAMIANILPAVLIVVLALILAALLRVLANLLQPVEVCDDDH